MTWEFLTDDLVLHFLRGFSKIKIRIQILLFFHVEYQTFQCSLQSSLFRFTVLQLPAGSALVHTINYQWPFLHLFASKSHSCKEHHRIKHHNRGLLRQEGAMLCDIARIYSAKIWGMEQPGERGVEETGEIYERLAELAVEIGRVTGSCQQLCKLWDGKSMDYYLLAAVLKMHLTERGLRRLFLSSVLQIWLHLYIFFFFFFTVHWSSAS